MGDRARVAGLAAADGTTSVINHGAAGTKPVLAKKDDQIGRGGLHGGEPVGAGGGDARAGPHQAPERQEPDWRDTDVEELRTSAWLEGVNVGHSTRMASRPRGSLTRSERSPLEHWTQSAHGHSTASCPADSLPRTESHLLGGPAVDHPLDYLEHFRAVFAHGRSPRSPLLLVIF